MSYHDFLQGCKEGDLILMTIKGSNTGPSPPRLTSVVHHWFFMILRGPAMLICWSPASLSTSSAALGCRCAPRSLRRTFGGRTVSGGWCWSNLYILEIVKHLDSNIPRYSEYLTYSRTYTPWIRWSLCWDLSLSSFRLQDPAFFTSFPTFPLYILNLLDVSSLICWAGRVHETHSRQLLLRSPVCWIRPKKEAGCLEVLHCSSVQQNCTPSSFVLMDL